MLTIIDSGSIWPQDRWGELPDSSAAPSVGHSQPWITPRFTHVEFLKEAKEDSLASNGVDGIMVINIF